VRAPGTPGVPCTARPQEENGHEAKKRKPGTISNWPSSRLND
jgi:hypothetical protein